MLSWVTIEVGTLVEIFRRGNCSEAPELMEVGGAVFFMMGHLTW